MLSRSKAPKTQTTGGLQTADQQKNYQTFFDGTKRAFTLAPEIIFFAKVSVPVLSIIPLLVQEIIDYTETENFAKEPKLARLLRELKLAP